MKAFLLLTCIGVFAMGCSKAQVTTSDQTQNVNDTLCSPSEMNIQIEGSLTGDVSIPEGSTLTASPAQLDEEPWLSRPTFPLSLNGNLFSGSLSPGAFVFSVMDPFGAPLSESTNFVLVSPNEDVPSSGGCDFATQGAIVEME